MKTSGLRSIADRYVKALFDTAADKKSRDAVEGDLAALSGLYQESAEFRDLLSNPLLSRGQQEQILTAVLTSFKAAKITQQFLTMLARQKRLPLLPSIITIFAEKVAAERGEMSAEVQSAAPLSKEEMAAIADRLSKAYGKKIVINTRVKPELLGGLVVKIGSQQLDSSLAGKMRRLKLALKAA